jgi:hypothetical protein
MNYYPLCKNEISFLFREHKVATNLPSILYFLLHEDGQGSLYVF